MAKPTTNFFIFLIVLIGAIFCFFRFVINNGEKAEEAVKKEGVSFENKLPADYSQVLKSFDTVTFVNSIYSNNRSPISGFSYKHYYTLMLYKLPVKGDQSLNKIIHEELVNSDLPGNSPYWNFSDNHFTRGEKQPCNILYKHGGTGKASGIYLDISGSGINSEKSDSVFSYKFNMNNFSIRYGVNQDVDFYGSKNDNLTSPNPAQIEFRLFNGSIYLIVITLTAVR